LEEILVLVEILFLVLLRSLLMMGNLEIAEGIQLSREVVPLSTKVEVNP